MAQFQNLHRVLHGLKRIGKALTPGLEHGDIGTLKGIDGLFRIAHHERAMTGGEFIRQPLDHLPLRGAGVLRLIDQNRSMPPSSRNSTHAMLFSDSRAVSSIRSSKSARHADFRIR